MSTILADINDQQILTQEWLIAHKKQHCPRCAELIGNVNGSKEAICQNCGYKDPCCE